LQKNMVRSHSLFPTRLERRLLLAALAGLGALLTTGCARSTVTTDIKADGSWARSIQFHGPSPGGNAGPGANLAPKVEDIFDIPSGGPWKSKKEQTEDEMVYTVERDHAAGETQKQDVSVRSKGKSPFLINAATVDKSQPGQITYREVLHWQGPLPKDVAQENADMLAAIKSALPNALATDENAHAIGKEMNRAMLLVVFGPPDPFIAHMFSELIMEPDLAQRDLTRRMGKPLNAILEAKFGDRMSLAERRTFAHKILDNVFKSTQSKFKSKTKPDPTQQPGGDDDMSSLVSLTFHAKFPGKILSTNGEADDFTNEVYWGVYPEAAALGDVVLTATCEAPQKTARR